ncbi:hypothetical protein BGZ98_008694 [Dissophora globulifera]|nr:hypothetical protein BGZ98_008694 [Dissophora globulifera]
MSSASSCSSSPFSSPETAADLDTIDLAGFFPTIAEPSFHHQIFDLDTTASADLLLAHSPQYNFTAAAHHQKSQQFQFDLAQIGLDTPPTSPSAPAFHKYSSGVATEFGAMYYPTTTATTTAAVQAQAVQNVYVNPTQSSMPILLLQQQQQQSPQQPQQGLMTAQQHQELLAYALMRQFNNPESSLSTSPVSNFSSSSGSNANSLSNSPYIESSSSPLTAVSSDFVLFPTTMTASNTGAASSAGFPSVPVMAPPVSSAIMYAGNGQGVAGFQHQMTPPMSQNVLQQEVATMFSQQQDALGMNAGVLQQPQQSQQVQQLETTDMSLLCKCPGKFPCAPLDSAVSCVSSPLEGVSEEASEEEDEDEDESEEDEDDQDDEEMNPSYQPTLSAEEIKSNKNYRNRAVFTPLTTSRSSNSSLPYNSPFTRESSASSFSPRSPVRQDRRRSSSGSYSSFGSSSPSSVAGQQQQLLDPQAIPEIKDIHVCPVCDRRFTRPFNLRSHLMTHTTARPFPCDECHWKFTRQHDLLRHKRAKHPNSMTDSASGDAGAQKKESSKSRSVAVA